MLDIRDVRFSDHGSSDNLRLSGSSVFIDLPSILRLLAMVRVSKSRAALFLRLEAAIIFGE
jgi:hypothetical protein